jgi:hypothetical protein
MDAGFGLCSPCRSVRACCSPWAEAFCQVHDSLDHLKGVKISSVMSHAYRRDAIRRECFPQGFCCWCSEAGALWSRAARVGQAIDADAND